VTADSPSCVGFAQGVQWGACYSECEIAVAEWWFDVQMWGDSLTVELGWDSEPPQWDGCTGTITVAVTSDATEVASHTGDLLGTRLISARVVAGADGASVASAAASVASLDDITVTSDTGTVLARTATDDVIVEVPTSLAKCSYRPCGSVWETVAVSATNAHASEERVLRLALSRQFPTGDSSLTQSGTGAEITGLSVLLLDGDGRPTGLPLQISKNWHSGSSDAYWAGYDGYWWTATALLRLPADSTIALSFGVACELANYAASSVTCHRDQDTESFEIQTYNVINHTH
jgi:hypothetical protein